MNLHFFSNIFQMSVQKYEHRRYIIMIFFDYNFNILVYLGNSQFNMQESLNNNLTFVNDIF